MYKIDPKTILEAAQNKYGKDVDVSFVYWIDDTSHSVRVGISLNGITFGANYYYKESTFK